MPRVHALITGRVQGVGFRYTTQVMAEDLNLTGWVRNLIDGRVEMLAEGPQDRLEELVADLRQSPGFSLVKEVDCQWGEGTGEFSRFSVAR